jgi:hypothetical protein
MSTARERCPRSVSTMPRPIESSPMTANGPTGRVHDAADLGHLAVHVRVRRRVARRRSLAARGSRHDVAVEVAEDHVLGRQVVVRHPRGLDDEPVGAGHPARHVAAGPHHEPVPHELAVQAGDLGTRARDGLFDVDIHA